MLRLALVQGVGPGRLAMLVRAYGGADAALAAPGHQLAAMPGIGPALLGRIRAASGAPARAATRAALRRLQRIGAVAVTPEDPLYPDAFRTITDPPYLLFMAGDPALLDTLAVAVVGTRAPTHYGRATARRISRDLAGAGVTVVSGVARGIDSAAHLGALDAEGATIGVLGHGIDSVYPSENRELFRRIREHGLLLTEYPPGESPKAGNFPRRNRLITALSRGVLVVEMSHRSGAQHTVGFALDQGRDVMAVPGPVGSQASEGTNQLIRDGARLVTSADEVLEEVHGVSEMARQRCGGTASSPSESTTPQPPPSQDEARVLALLGVVPRHIDELARETGTGMGPLLATLLALELAGRIQPLPGQRYCLRG